MMLRSDDALPLVIREATQACDRACAHCRASAAPRRQTPTFSQEEEIKLPDPIEHSEA
ncbi:MAG: hypothetical protein ABSB35_07570 [Bryobacteraceae bacterium]